jgi:hypothetical protein
MFERFDIILLLIGGVAKVEIDFWCFWPLLGCFGVLLCRFTIVLLPIQRVSLCDRLMSGVGSGQAGHEDERQQTTTSYSI